MKIKKRILILALMLIFNVTYSSDLFLESEGFKDKGGWVLDQQFMDQMGSPFLLAHGLGIPVKDAVTSVKFTEAGKYRLWVRTRDWVAPWKTASTPGHLKAKGDPGKFQVLIDGKPLETTFGIEGAQWHWQDGGIVEIKNKKIKLALHDLTGFEGRCDALYFSSDLKFRPPNDLKELEKFRSKKLGFSKEPKDAGEFDIVVSGGGIAGICSAISAARLGLKVALIQDRPVLGGNNSSEVRVGLCGATNLTEYTGLGNIVNELEPAKRVYRGMKNFDTIHMDNKRESLVKRENIYLFLNCRVNGIEMDGCKIKSVTAQNIKTGQRLRFKGVYFADCTGDGCIAYMAKADYEITKKEHMGRTNLWDVADTGKPSPFPKCPWALELSDKPFPGRGNHTAQYAKKGLNSLGAWFWESGFSHDQFEKGEYIRDWNFRAMYGAWDCLKNREKKYPNHQLNWAAYIAGMRESRRILGDVILTEKDILKNKRFPDGIVGTVWSIDLHLPNKNYIKGFEGDAFISKAHHTNFKKPYYVPYRCFYSRNIDNLFMAGRNVSVSHKGLGTVRVMRTTGMMGELVGMAAYLAKKYKTSPRGVYQDHLEELKALAKKGTGKPHPQQSLDNNLKKFGKNLIAESNIKVEIGRSPKKLLCDGIAVNNKNRWLSEKKMPVYIEFKWKKDKKINRLQIISGNLHYSKINSPICDFVFQYHDNKKWKNIPKTMISGNQQNDWSVEFPTIKASNTRLKITKSPGNIVRIWEIAVFEE